MTPREDDMVQNPMLPGSFLGLPSGPHTSHHTHKLSKPADQVHKASPKRKYKFQRASVACAECRHAKTRCNYLNNGRSCFRCENLGLSCSLGSMAAVSGKEDKPVVTPSSSTSSFSGHSLRVARSSPTSAPTSVLTLPKSQFDILSAKLDTIAQQLQVMLHSGTSLDIDLASELLPSLEQQVQAVQGTVQTPGIPTPPADVTTDPYFFTESPCLQLRQVAAYLGMHSDIPEQPSKAVQNTQAQAQAQGPLGPLGLPVPENPEFGKFDAVENGIVDYDSAIKMLHIFRRHYADVAPFEMDDDVEDWFERTRHVCPLLVSACILLALRHFHQGDYVYESLDLALRKNIHGLLSATMGRVSPSLESIQALCLVSQFALTLSWTPRNIDGWWLTSYALVHFFSQKLNGTLQPPYLQYSFRFLTNAPVDDVPPTRLFTRLAVTHISHCLFTGRPCMLDGQMLRKCVEVPGPESDYSPTSSPEEQQGDTVASAELAITWYLYQHLRSTSAFEASLQGLDELLQKWSALFPAGQLDRRVQTKYTQAQLLLSRKYLVRHMALKGTPQYDGVLLRAFQACRDMCYRESLLDGDDVQLFAHFYMVFILHDLTKRGVAVGNSAALAVECADRFLLLCSRAANANASTNDPCKYMSLFIGSLRASLEGEV